MVSWTPLFGALHKSGTYYSQLEDNSKKIIILDYRPIVIISLAFATTYGGVRLVGDGKVVLNVCGGLLTFPLKLAPADCLDLEPCNTLQAWVSSSHGPRVNSPERPKAL